MAPKKSSVPSARSGKKTEPKKPIDWDGIGGKVEQANLKEWMQKFEKKTDDEKRAKLIEVAADLAKYEKKLAKYEADGALESEDATKATQKLRKLQLQNEFLEENVTLSPARGRTGDGAADPGANGDGNDQSYADSQFSARGGSPTQARDGPEANARPRRASSTRQAGSSVCCMS